MLEKIRLSYEIWDMALAELDSTLWNHHKSVEQNRKTGIKLRVMCRSTATYPLHINGKQVRGDD